MLRRSTFHALLFLSFVRTPVASLTHTHALFSSSDFGRLFSILGSHHTTRRHSRLRLRLSPPLAASVLDSHFSRSIWRRLRARCLRQVGTVGREGEERPSTPPVYSRSSHQAFGTHRSNGDSHSLVVLRSSFFVHRPSFLTVVRQRLQHMDMRKTGARLEAAIRGASTPEPQMNST